jgi:HD-GYP domain-containing protein (c-di-GMP phosphodiesterase class II)
MKISKFKLVQCLSLVIDHISRKLHQHHQRVAQIAWLISREMKLDPEESYDLFLAGLVHDCGAISLKERLDELVFDHRDDFLHPHAGHYLLTRFKPFTRIADIIRFHHVSWETSAEHEQIPVSSRVLHFADKISSRFDETIPVEQQKKEITTLVKTEAGRLFKPEVVNAFLRVIDSNDAWDSLFFHPSSTTVAQSVEPVLVPFGKRERDQFSQLLCQLIDFKSPYTACHSTGVGFVAGELGRLLGLDTKTRGQLVMAGQLHDIGKLGLPSEIINKTEALTPEEDIQIREHAMNTYRMLSVLSDELGLVVEWAAYHHERLNGSGYPFSLSAGELSTEARLIGIADIFTAIREERPYRDVMDINHSAHIIKNMITKNLIDETIGKSLLDNIEELDEKRSEVQRESRKEYDAYRESVKSDTL